MEVDFHEFAAALYLLAGVGEAIAYFLSISWLAKRSVGALGLGWVMHCLAIFAMHEMDPAPPLNSLPAVLSFTTWLGVLAYLLFLRKSRITGLIAIIGPMAFIGTFFCAAKLTEGIVVTTPGDGAIPHAHVLLGASGLAFLGIAGISGAVFLMVSRMLKTKSWVDRKIKLPSLEALDRVSLLSLAFGFPLLTVGFAAGVLWLKHAEGAYWTGSAHEVWNSIVWVLYAALFIARFVRKQGSHEAAVSSVVGFALLLFAVVGVRLLS